MLVAMPINKTTPEQSLAALGFTETEAVVYCELLRAPASTGYRLAPSIGKAAASVYQALAALSQKGAVLVDDTETKTYRAVPPSELIAALSKSFEARAAQAVQSLEGLHEPQPDDRLYQLSSVDQVFERATAMIDGAKEIVGRGINGIQLLWDEKRWWVVTIMWDAESPAQPIPAQYDAKR